MAHLSRGQAAPAPRTGRNPWKLFERRDYRPGAPMSCLCIPYAGGSGSVFSDWAAPLSGRMDVVAAHLPGRGKRFSEAPYPTFDELLDDLESAALAFTAREFVLFGHSLGGLLAYELAHRLHARHMRNAIHVFISGMGAPHIPDPDTAALTDDDHRLSDHALARKLAALGGLPPEIPTQPELMEIALATVRADLKVYASYAAPSHSESRRIPCPITVYGGNEDLHNVPEEALREWSGYTRGRFGMQLFPGDHFFLHSQRDAVISHMLRELE